MKIFIANYMLAGGEELDQVPFDVELFVEARTQIAETLRAPAAVAFNRGNRTTRLSFRVRRKFPSIQQAMEFLLTHATGLASISGDVTVVSENAPSPRSYRLSGAAIRRIQGNQQGCSTTHGYEIIGGLFSPVVSTQEA
jgi:hypothetical protein